MASGLRIADGLRLEEAAGPCSAGRSAGSDTGSAQEAAAIRTAPAKSFPTILFIDSPKSWNAPHLEILRSATTLFRCPGKNGCG
jgi:hypothetical protein